jgi:hypothetical protein
MQAVTQPVDAGQRAGHRPGRAGGHGYDSTDASAALELIAYMNTVALA